MHVRLLLLFEMEVADSASEHEAHCHATRRLDEFRESVQPFAEHGISLWRTYPPNLVEEGIGPDGFGICPHDQKAHKDAREMARLREKAQGVVDSTHTHFDSTQPHFHDAIEVCKAFLKLTAPEETPS